MLKNSLASVSAVIEGMRELNEGHFKLRDLIKKWRGENLIKTGTNGNEKVRARFTLKLCEPSYDGFARSLRI